MYFSPWQIEFKRSVRFWLGCAALGMGVALLAACKPNYPPNPRPTLHTTISADGQMVATLLNAGTEEQRLRVKRLEPEGPWEEIKAPPFTQTIRFGLTGHELLLTHNMPEKKQDRLVKMDLDKPANAPQTIYQDDELAFPLEVTPGQIMVRTCPNKNQPGAHQCRYLGYRWQMVGLDGHATQVGPDTVGGWTAPTLVGTGFFWIEEQTGPKKEANPKVLSYGLPNGQAPDFPRERLAKDTMDVKCDRLAARCLRRYIANLTRPPAGAFIYDVEANVGAERCSLEDVAGSTDGIQITPNGNAAVMSLTTAYDQPRHVVVIRFKPGRCEPTSIQHINF